ncbi:hypothetical protein CNR22_11225 [Sphingobacteriaceae bacterium]|nr:hypothetical protein CNR22_11225 [Sphingobacteriaceae bacterium]
MGWAKDTIFSVDKAELLYITVSTEVYLFTAKATPDLANFLSTRQQSTKSQFLRPLPPSNPILISV